MGFLQTIKGQNSQPIRKIQIANLQSGHISDPEQTLKKQWALYFNQIFNPCHYGLPEIIIHTGGGGEVGL